MYNMHSFTHAIPILKQPKEERERERERERESESEREREREMLQQGIWFSISNTGQTFEIKMSLFVVPKGKPFITQKKKEKELCCGLVALVTVI